MAPRVSIVAVLACAPAPAWRCLEAMAAQPADPSFEVIVVAPAAPWLDPVLDRLDGDLAIVRSDQPWTLAQAFAHGLERVTGETVVLLRDGAAPAPGWLSPLVQALADPQVGTALSLTAAAGPETALAALSAAWRAGELPTQIPLGTPDDLLIAQLALGLAERGLRSQPVPVSRVAAPRPVTPSEMPAHGTAVELTVVVPTLDAGSERTRRCLAAIRATTTVAHEVVVVDNGTPAQGFSGPVNAGLRAADTPFVVVMNDDVEPLPGWWEPLRTMLESGTAVAFPKTVDSTLHTAFGAWCFAMTRATIEHFSHAPGAFFDPALVIWFQDSDLLVRLKKAGRPPVRVDSSQIRHGRSQTLRDPDPALAAWVRRQIESDQEIFTARWPEVELIPEVAA